MTDLDSIRQEMCDMLAASEGVLLRRIEALEARAGQTVDLDKYELLAAQIRELYEWVTDDRSTCSCPEKMAELWPWLADSRPDCWGDCGSAIAGATPMDIGCDDCDMEEKVQ